MKKNDYKIALPLVKQINRVYLELQNLSNDELRKRTRELKHRILTSSDKDILDVCLVECFAIVKDTARRFSEGEVKVVANAFDKKIAQKYDFIVIDGKYARYKNEWKAGGANFKWNMIHYDTQIIAGIFMHRGYAVEMATGEGKTLAVTLPAFLNSLNHKGVHIQTVNNYLSKRDCEMTRPLYMFHGITTDCLEYYTGDVAKTKKAFSCDICFGSNETFVFDYLRNNHVFDEKFITQKSHNFCIVDELDSIFIDRACTPYLLQGETLQDETREELMNLKGVIEKFVALDNIAQLVKVSPVKRNLSISREACNWFDKELGCKDLFGVKPEDLNSEDEAVKTEAWRKRKIAYNIVIMLTAYCVYKRDVDYVVDRNKIVIINVNTGRLDYGTRWENGIHQAVEIKEEVKCEDVHNSLSIISLGNYLKLYTKKCGMSGTIRNVSDELKETYGLSCVHIPTRLPVIRKDNPIQVYKNEEKKYEALATIIGINNKKHRPILVSCISTLESDIVSKFLKDNGFEIRTLNAKNLEKEAYIISHAGELDAITVSTAIAGRGTDIKLSEEAKATGGLLVLSTCMFDSSRIDEQLRGRAGRQGDPGESIFLVSLDDLILMNLSLEEQNKIKADFEEKNIINVNQSFTKAQKIREADLKERRQLYGSLDNNLSKCRKSFFKERNRVLKNPLKVYEHLKEETILYNATSAYEDLLDNLYQKVKLIFENAKNNNVDGEMPVIFSEKQEPFSIYFDIESLLSDKNYFVTRFVQQLSLTILDLFWSYFINSHRMSFRLSEKDLLKDYRKIKENCDRLTLQKLFGSCIPVNHVEIVEEEKGEERDIAPKDPKDIRETTKIKIYEKCPCGSGKPYLECHGRRLLQ